MPATPVTWTVTAVNAPEHAGNAIHTDAGAREQGFPAALVAGVSTYAYLTHPLVTAWGLDWLARGGGEIRFRSPVFAGDRVDCVPTPTERGTRVEAVCCERSPAPNVIFDAVRDTGPPPGMRGGEELPGCRFELDGEFGPGYGRRAGDTLDVYERDGVVHPAVWPAIANRLFSRHLVRGPWIHTRSIIRHHGLAPAGAVVDVNATVVERFVRRGERAIVDVSITLDGEPVATLEHEAIVDLAVTG